MEINAEPISEQNRKELRKIQEEQNLTNFRVLIAPNIQSSVEECIAGTLELVKGTVVQGGELVDDLDVAAI